MKGVTFVVCFVETFYIFVDFYENKQIMLILAKLYLKILSSETEAKFN